MVHEEPRPGEHPASHTEAQITNHREDYFPAEHVHVHDRRKAEQAEPVDGRVST